MVHGPGPDVADGSGPDLIVDDGGDATLLIHKGLEYEKAGAIPDFDADNDPRNGVSSSTCCGRLRRRILSVGAARRLRFRACRKRRPPACTASTR